MPKLTVTQNGETKEIRFVGNPLIGDILAYNGYNVARPCGGRGVCGNCGVNVEGSLSEMTPREAELGKRLACKTHLTGDAAVILPDTPRLTVIQTEGAEYSGAKRPRGKKLGAAVDIGTTTMAVKLYDMVTGEELADAAGINPQTETAADIMGRIDAAMNGKSDQLKTEVNGAIASLLDEACRKADKSRRDVDAAVITGNTVMLYLFEGKNPVSLSRAPFEADCLFDVYGSFGSAKTYLPPCMNAFVGADITCAVLASGMFEKDEISLLCDIGTNGEIALYKEGKLYVTSTAAGPAFEGAGISCGCGSVAGAIDKVWLANGQISVRTIGGEDAVGICGSGLIDAVAAFLQAEMIDETGAADDELTLTENVKLLGRDIRAVQLAKAAIAAGIETLLDSAKVTESEIGTLYIAGGFGSHLDIKSAVAIGLIPKSLAGKVEIIGNAALSGAVKLLLDTDAEQKAMEIAASSTHVNLGGNPKFNSNYIEHMMF